MKEFPERVRLVRGTMKQADFARSLGIPLSTLGRYERGETRPDISFLVSVCANYEISLNWLVMGIGEMHIGETGAGCASAPSACQNCSECLALLTKASDKLYQSIERERELLQEKSSLLLELALLRSAGR